MDKDIKELVISSFAERCQMDSEEIAVEDTIQSIIGTEFYLFSHILLDIHEKMGITSLEFDANKEFELFHTLQDVIDYLAVLK